MKTFCLTVLLLCVAAVHSHCRGDKCESDGGKCVPRGLDEKSCVFNKCRKGKDLKKSIQYCKLDDGSCLKPRRAWTNPESCCRYKCSKDGELSRTYACKVAALKKCVRKGKSRKDKSSCVVYSCSDDLKTSAVHYGCLDKNSKCRRPGRKPFAAKINDKEYNYCVCKLKKNDKGISEAETRCTGSG